MEYAIHCGDELVSVFDAASLGEAVEKKNGVQAAYNKRHGCQEIFHVRMATRAERRRMKKETAGFLVLPKK